MALADFFDDALSSLGAVCERTWHNRLHVLAEGLAARPWRDDDAMVETEILFHSPGQSSVGNAAAEAFPGCPLTFRLAETRFGAVRSLDRIVLRSFEATPRPPSHETAERTWHAQFPGCIRWRIERVPVAAWNFSLLVLIRCEIQATDQHWSLHRLAISLADGQTDPTLSENLALAEAEPNPPHLSWPAPDLPAWTHHLRSVLRHELEPDLAGILRRQENYLRRELDRIDDYFDGYERELLQRQQHTNSDAVKAKMMDRLKAAAAERENRRQDQLHRHEIRVLPHVDALCLLAEPAWRVPISFVRQGTPSTAQGLFIPRSRRWLVSL